MLPKGTVLFGSIFKKIPFLEKLLNKNPFHFPKMLPNRTVPFGSILLLALVLMSVEVGGIVAVEAGGTEFTSAHIPARCLVKCIKRKVIE